MQIVDVCAPFTSRTSIKSNVVPLASARCVTLDQKRNARGQYMRELLEDVRKGDLSARNQLFRMLQQDQRVNRTIRSLIFERAVVEPEDIKSEFWRGVLQGMACVRHDVGDPVLHLVQRGVWQVKSIVKSEIGKRIVQTCTRCGRINVKYSYSRICKVCKAPTQNDTRHSDITDHDSAAEYVDSIAHHTTVNLTRTVTPSQYRVLELLIQACIDGSNRPQVDVARILGISRMRVGQQLNKIRDYVYLTQ